MEQRLVMTTQNLIPQISFKNKKKIGDANSKKDVDSIFSHYNLLQLLQKDL